MTDETVRDDPAKSRYELAIGDGIAIAAYRLEDGVMSFTHTEVPETLEGQGIASRLIAGALADVRERGLRIRPLCAFVAAYIERHPDARDLVVEG